MTKRSAGIAASCGCNRHFRANAWRQKGGRRQSKQHPGGISGGGIFTAAQRKSAAWRLAYEAAEEGGEISSKLWRPHQPSASLGAGHRGGSKGEIRRRSIAGRRSIKMTAAIKRLLEAAINQSVTRKLA